MQLWSIHSSRKCPPHFPAAFVVALLLFAVFGCNRQRVPPTDEEVAVGSIGRPIHTFIADNPASTERIGCPVVGDASIDEIFSRKPPRCWMAGGWSRAFDWGSWAKSHRSEFAVHLGTPEDHILNLRARASANLPPDRQQTITLNVNGRALGSREINRTYSRLRFDIPADALRAGRNDFALDFAHLTPIVGSATGKVEISQAAGVSELFLEASEKSGHGVVQNTTDIWDPDRACLVVDQPGILVLPVFVPMDAIGLDLELRSNLVTDVAAPAVQLAVVDLDGNAEHAAEVRAASGKEPVVARLSVDRLAGRWSLVTLTFAASDGATDVLPPRFVTDEPDDRGSDAVPVETPCQRPPNIVMITLDAARADRFSFNGHERQTTPFIDSLAQESLTFANAYALAPYTLCSVPTMITGLSFLDHGVVNHEDVLSSDAVTLAESLRDAGYFTAAFSATPNNSRAKGFDQGYDVFFEMWTEGEKKDTRRAPYIARRVVEWLEGHPDDGQPFHLQVHMVPPHAPYDPPPAFDRYTDPDYDGPCDGWPRTVFNLNAGVVEATPECVEHVLALYDGNLNVADDATRVIVEALRRRPTWDNTVVLVTSDHGEAFMEHGRIGHNATLYTEMLHVPFVLRMPEGTPAAGIDTHGLATVADIVPTLLHAAGLTPPRLTDGVDLLDRRIDRGGRVMVGRTATRQPVLGLRTLRWNLMVNPAGSGGLFDQLSDRNELQNLVGEHPETYAGLGKILAARVALPPQLDASQTDALSDEERELLETLGYVR